MEEVLQTFLPPAEHVLDEVVQMCSSTLQVAAPYIDEGLT